MILILFSEMRKWMTMRRGEKRREEERKRNKKRVIRRWYRAHRGTSFVYNTSVERLSAIQCAPSPSPFYSRHVLREWLTKLLPHSSSHSRAPLPPLLMSMTSMPPPPQWWYNALTHTRTQREREREREREKWRGVIDLPLAQFLLCVAEITDCHCSCSSTDSHATLDAVSCSRTLWRSFQSRKEGEGKKVGEIGRQRNGPLQKKKVLKYSFGRDAMRWRDAFRLEIGVWNWFRVKREEEEDDDDDDDRGEGAVLIVRRADFQSPKCVTGRTRRIFVSTLHWAPLLWSLQEKKGGRGKREKKKRNQEKEKEERGRDGAEKRTHNRAVLSIVRFMRDDVSVVAESVRLERKKKMLMRRRSNWRMAVE